MTAAPRSAFPLDGTSRAQDTLTRPDLSWGQKCVRPVADPHAFAADLPELWSDFCRRNYRDARHLAQAFGVSESCARKWWDGAGGTRGHQLQIAVALHPEDAFQTFFGIAAE